MARKKRNKSIEEELEQIEREERQIESEEKQIGQKEDLLRMFEELGLMRWKSYYILTAGAILLLSLTFVTSLWVMHDQMVDMQATLNAVSVGVDNLQDSSTTAAPEDWCPEDQSVTLASGPAESGIPDMTAEVLGREDVNGTTMCHSRVTSNGKVTDVYFDKKGNTIIK